MRSTPDPMKDWGNVFNVSLNTEGYAPGDAGVSAVPSAAINAWSELVRALSDWLTERGYEVTLHSYSVALGGGNAVLRASRT